MKVKCLSVRNPISYLIVAGFKDVENRNWKTDYRGDLYIQSSGQKDRYDINIKDWYKFMPLHKELDIMKFDEKRHLTNGQSLKYFDFDPEKREFFLKSGKKNKLINTEYDLIKRYHEGFINKNPFFKSKAIIGKVELVDIVTESNSIFAEPAYKYYWILKNPIMFKKPYLFVKGKLRLFDVNLRKGA